MIFTVIEPFGDRSHRDSAFENSASRSQSHGRDVSAVRLRKEGSSEPPGSETWQLMQFTFLRLGPSVRA